MTYRQAVLYGEEQLKEAQIADAKTDAWILLAKVCHIDHTFYYVHLEEDMTEEQAEEYRTIIAKRAERIPLQYITGEQMFMGIPFRVNENVLVPRQDTETLVEEGLKVVKPGMHILDLCTGSGCILISILKNSRDVVGMGSDISKQALAVAKENARMNEVQAVFEWGNLFENIEERFDLILSNPPYIPTSVVPTLMAEVAEFEPIGALDGGEDGLDFYRRIVEEAGDYLNPGGYLMFEIGYDQGEEVSLMMQQKGYQNVRVIKDLAGNDRVVAGHL